MLIFDLDGTLVDSLDDLTDAANAALAAIGRPAISSATLKSYVGDGLSNLLKRCLGTDLSGLEAAHAAFEAHYSHHAARKTRPYPGIPDLLASLHSEPMAVVSNKPFHFCAQILETLDLARHFAIILGGDSLPEKKPSPLPLEAALRSVSHQNQTSLMIGDGPQDIRAARRAGIPSVATLWGFTSLPILAAEHPTHLAQTVEDLAALLRVRA